VIALLFLVGCQQEQNVPTAADFANEREKLVKRVAERKAKKAAAPQKAARRKAAEKKGEDGFAGSGSGFAYEPSVQRDPFRSFEWQRLELEEDVLRGPLEQYDVSQLEVAAVVWKTGSARALVKDPAGQSYIIGVGTRVGKNDGTVTQIDDSLVIVKETYVDYLGHETKKDVELRIRRTEGG
jgi:Tfp pilus assembly protein PilP